MPLKRSTVIKCRPSLTRCRMQHKLQILQSNNSRSN